MVKRTPTLIDICDDVIVTLYNVIVTLYNVIVTLYNVIVTLSPVQCVFTSYVESAESL